MTYINNLVDLREPICQAIDSAKADMAIFASSRIEAFISKNGSKYINRIINPLKAYTKTHNFDKSYAPYKATYGSMLSHISATPAIKQLDIIVMSLNSILSLTDWESSVIFLFTTRIF